MLARSPEDTIEISLDRTSPYIRYDIASYFLTREGVVKFDGKGTAPKNALGFQGRFRESRNETSITLDIRTATLIHENGGENIFDIGSFELVNFHQWSGTKPDEIRFHFKAGRNSPSTPPVSMGEEPPLWEIAAVNMATGERIVLVRSHCSKDHIFIVLNRINAIIDYGRVVCEPWRDTVTSDDPIPEPDVEDTLSGHPPRFKFKDIPSLEYEEDSKILRYDPNRPSQDDSSKSSAATINNEASNFSKFIVVAVIAAFFLSALLG